MNKAILTMVMGLLFVGFNSHAQLPSKEVAVGVNSAFIPGGFDSASDVFVVVSGIFSNTCYSWKDARIEKSSDSNVISITSIAMVSQGICMQVLVPFQKEVHVGQLAAGDYTLKFASGDGTYFEKSLHIEQ